jgi:hypothetical protein
MGIGDNMVGEDMDAQRDEYEEAKRRQDIIKLISDVKNILEKCVWTNENIFLYQRTLDKDDILPLQNEIIKSINKLDKAVNLI